MGKNIAFILFLILVFVEAWGQQQLIINSEGIPPMTEYTDQDYQGYGQIWDVTQSDEGLIYLAGSYGLYEFDGENWRSVISDESYTPRMFAHGKSGKIYIAGMNVLGYLAPDSSGLIKYHSLEYLLKSDMEVGHLVFVKVMGEKVFFSGTKGMFVYDETHDSLQFIKTSVRTYPSFIFHDKFYFLLENEGLCIYENDTIEPASNGELFKGILISDFVSDGADGIIGIAGTNHDYYYYNSDSSYIKPYYKDTFLIDKLPYRINKISDDYYGISYLNGGYLIADNQFNPVLHLDEDLGINNQTYSSFLDKENNLWVTNTVGVAVVELGAAHSILDKRIGLTGSVSDMQTHGDKMYVSTATGLYSKSSKTPLTTVGSSRNAFKKIKNSDIYNDDLIKSGGVILSRGYQSMGQIKNDNYEILYHGFSAQSEFTFLADSNHVLTLGDKGNSLEVFRMTNGNWSHYASIAQGMPEKLNNFKYDRERDLIWAANEDTLISFKIINNNKVLSDLQSYGSVNGLPDNSFTWVQALNTSVVFSTIDGIYEFDETSSQFSKSLQFGEYFDEIGLARFVDRNDSSKFYLTQQYEKGIADFNHSPVRMKQMPSTLVMPTACMPIYYDSRKGSFWGSATSLLFVQEGKPENTKFPFTPLIRQVDVISGKDSTIFNGLFGLPEGTFSYNQQTALELDYGQNALRFSYAVPYFRHPEHRQYQFQLVGFEEGWSEWTDKTEKEYTNLSSGKYIFKVKARNGFLIESKVGEFSFVIQPPWYQTIWIYMLYLGLFVGLVYLIVNWNSKRLKTENLKLEGIIAERTTEIRDQKNIIEKALMERESLLKEIHHRVKNNLQIIASLLYLQSGKFEDEDFKRVLEEGQGRVRSMALIHQKLYENDDLKSIPFGEYLQELLGEIKASFGQTTEGIAVKVYSEDIQFDVETAIPLGLIVNELATNAFKYAFDGLNKGVFSISLKKDGDQFVLSVSDNGRGIPDEIDIKKTKSLGLRLVKMLSVQLEAEYSFESVEGTHFIMKFAA